jgi:G3E family GTPase
VAEEPSVVTQDPRLPVVLVAGLTTDTERVAEALLRRPGTVVAHHGLRQVQQGVVHRRLRWAADEPAGEPRDEHAVLELAHGCVSCTLREDLLPLVRRLAGTPGVRRVVLHLDPALEPEMISWSLHHLLLDGATLDEQVRVEAVITTVEAATWLADAVGEDTLAERGLAGSPDDERTVAQVTVDQVEFADAIVVVGAAPNAWAGARTNAVLERLAPLAPRIRLDWLDVEALLSAIPPGARRGAIDDAHAPLLRGQPPLESDCGVSVVLFSHRRPFHPQRLHDALGALVDGVVRTRARAWLASQPDVTLWLESAGAGMRIGHAGRWLAAMDADDRAAEDPERQAMAAARWHPYYGDRDQEFVVITHAADPQEITDALHGALLTDAELAEGETTWRAYPDPFGWWHTEPCHGTDNTEAPLGTRKEHG